MIIRVSFMVIASVAALKISQIKTKENKGSECSHLEQEFEERENSSENISHVIQNEQKMQVVKTDMPQNLLQGKANDWKLFISGEKIDYVTEKEILQNLIQNYKQNEVNLERKLVELKSLKQEKSAIAQMQRELEKKAAKWDSLRITTHSLRSESKIIQEKINENVLCKVQLGIANKIINEMQMKEDVNRSLAKDQILMLQQQVSELQKYKGLGRDAVVINRKLAESQDLKVKVLELKRRNKELEMEKRDVGIKLATTQARIRTEEEIVEQIQEEITCLRHVNEELSEQVENLQRNKFNMVDELVYQRWLYTCLRFEAHQHQKQIRKASLIQDCSKKSDNEYSDSELDSISSNATFNESDEIEITTLESLCSSQSSSTKNNSGILSKMRRWKKAKDYINNISPKGRSSPSRPSAVRRFSMSAVESDLSNLNMKLEKPMTRLRRVSFIDSVKSSTFQDTKEEVEDVIDDKKSNLVQIVKMTSTITSSDEHKAEDSDEGTKNLSGHSDEMCSNNEILGRKHERIKSQLGQLLVFFFFLLVLLAYFWTK